MMHRAGILGTVVTAALAVPGAAAGQTTLTQPYVGGPGYNTYVTVCADRGLNPSEENIGVVCFDDPQGDVVTAAIADEAGHPVSGYLIFVNAKGNWVYGGPFCESSKPVAIPRGARMIQVYLGGPFETAWHCTAFGRPGVAATRGEVSVTYTTVPGAPAAAQPAPVAVSSEPAQPKAAGKRCTRARSLSLRIPRKPVRVNGRRAVTRRGRITVDLRRYRGRVVEVTAGRRVVRRWLVCP